MKINNLLKLMILLAVLLVPVAIATNEGELAKIQLNTCSGDGELYVYAGDNPFQEADVSFETTRDELAVLFRPKYIEDLKAYKGGSATNIVSNPGFESGVSPWKFYSDGVAVLSTTTRDDVGGNAGRLRIYTTGDNVQMYQKDLTLEPATKYRLTFDARSNTGHDMKVFLHKHETSPTYVPYGLEQFVNLGTSWQSYTVEFTTSGFSSTVNDARLRFWFGPYDAVGDKFYVDNVVLTPIVDELTLTEVFYEDTPFEVSILTAQTTPGDTVSIKVDMVNIYEAWQARGIQAYLAQDSDNPIYDDWSSFRVLYSDTGKDSASDLVYLTAGRHELIIYGDYTINKPGQGLDLRDTIITVSDASGIISSDTYNQPFPEGIQGVIIHEFSVPEDGMYTLKVETDDSIYYSVVECDQPQTSVCEGADFIVQTDLDVAGDGCHWKGQISDSEEIYFPSSATYTIRGIAERGSPSDFPDYCQDQERFHIEVNGQSGPIVEDDPESCAITLTEEYLGTFQIEEGIQTVNMYTDAECPPDKEANSVHVDTLCFYEDGEIPEFGAIAASVALIGAIAGFFILRRKK